MTDQNEFVARCRVETEKASSYLQRLCKHFRHKVPAEWTESAGHAELPGGRAEFAATDQVLDIVIQGESEMGLARAKYIVEDHLVRFAFRENLTALDWK